MPIVKRIRPLGQPRLVHENTKKTNSEETIYKKKVRRFQPLTDQRRRKDKKHRYPLRVENELWEKIWELSLNCGSTKSGASLNMILIKLISYALEDETIYKRIQDEFPQRTEFIRIRSWGRDK